MKKILLFGAGRSATTLIRYLGAHANSLGWEVTIADASEELVHHKVAGWSHLKGIGVDVLKSRQRSALIQDHDFVISMLPWTLHSLVAKDCLRYGRHLITASYVNPEMRAMSRQARKKGLFFMGELGLDPGLDHMSALNLIRSLRQKGATITSFHSYAGGLVAESCDTNPWHYKITWNPRNIVLAGQGTIQYRHEGYLRLIPYTDLFNNALPITIAGKDRYEVYPNRDSLKYIQLYGLEGVPSIMRGTVRIRGFSKAWHQIVRLGLTESLTPLGMEDPVTWSEFLSGFLPIIPEMAVKDRCALHLGLAGDDPVMAQLDWLGLFSDRPIGPVGLAPADYLQALVEEKWALDPGDRDLVVMEHRIQYTLDGRVREVRSALEHEGEDPEKTAMADLVGLPLAHATRLFFDGAFDQATLPVPSEPCVAGPILRAMADEGIVFQEEDRQPEALQALHHLNP